MDTLSTALDLLFLPVYIFVVFTVHEYGHYFAARFFNISVESFSLGYGRALWSRTDRRGTCWSLRLFPICGHVHLSADRNKARGRLFEEAPLWHRITVVLAGPLANIILAFSVLFVFFVFFGQPSKQPVIAGIEPGEAAAQAGLRIGDRILAIDGIPVYRYRDVWNQTSRRAGEELLLRIKRDDQTLSVPLTPSHIAYTDPDGIERSHGRMGVRIGRSFFELDILESINDIDVKDKPDKARTILLDHLGQTVTVGLKSTDGKTHFYRTLLRADFNRHLNDPAHPDYDSFYLGPVKNNVYVPRDMTASLIAAGKQVGKLMHNVTRLPFQLFPVDKELVKPWALVADEDMFVRGKLYELFYRIALVSVLIALLNLVPFPGLDGSILLLLIIEGVLGPRSPAGKRAYKFILLTSLCLLYGFIMAANVSDFPRYVEKKMEDISKAGF